MRGVSQAGGESARAPSRTIARLEKGGPVSRGTCGEDRRGVRVVLTDEGRERHAQVRPLRREVPFRKPADRTAR